MAHFKAAPHAKILLPARASVTAISKIGGIEVQAGDHNVGALIRFEILQGGTQRA